MRFFPWRSSGGFLLLREPAGNIFEFGRLCAFTSLAFASGWLLVLGVVGLLFAGPLAWFAVVIVAVGMVVVVPLIVAATALGCLAYRVPRLLRWLRG